MAIKYTLDGEMVAEFGLCKDRHDYPVEECIYPNTVAMFAFGRLELDALEVLKPLRQQGLKRLVLYTSGCISAVLAVVNVCARLKIRDVVIMHYDSLNNGYQPQNIVTFNDVYL